MLSEFESDFISAAEFADRAIALLDSLDPDEAFYRRRGSVKQLLEEVLPLAIFARSLDAPECRVSCRYLRARADEPDGLLRLTGRKVDLEFYPSEISVEVTSAFDEKAYLRREKMATDGIVFSGNNIERTGSRHDPNSEIVSRPEILDGGSGPSIVASLVRSAIQRKAGKSYEPKRWLVVDLNPDFFVTHTALSAVAQESGAQAFLREFLGITMVDTGSGSAFRI